jgi:hypothetical protein
MASPLASERLQIVIWKWRDPRKSHLLFNYTSEAVNKLAKAISKNLSLPHDIVCITDDPMELSSHIRVIPLWAEARQLRGCWTRLKAFASEMRDLIGPRFAWVDLDSIIVGRLDPLFDRTEDAIFYRSDSISGTPYNGSMVLMTAGARAHVWESFDMDRSPELARESGYFGTDQAWIAYTLGPNETVWSREDGVMHFSLDCAPELPEHSRIVFFAGLHKPHMKTVQQIAPWVSSYVDEGGSTVGFRTKDSAAGR